MRDPPTVDIDGAINAIERVRQPTDAVSKEEGTIRRGSVSVPLAQLRQLLRQHWIGRTK
jgi:exocyst complex protein 7